VVSIQDVVRIISARLSIKNEIKHIIEEGKRMPDYCYEKHYDRNQMGSAILLNPEPLERYNQSRYELLIHEQD